MKKIIVLSMLTTFCTLAYGQFNNPSNNLFASNKQIERSVFHDEDPAGGSTEAASFLLGFRIMPTFSFFDVTKTDNSTIETTAVLSWGYGGLIGFNLSEHMGLQAEVIYSPMAQKYKDANGEGTIKLTYINIPLMMVLNTDYGAPVNLNVAFGPQIGINTGSKIESASDGNGSDTVHAVLAVKPSDIGFAYGAGLDFGLSPTAKLCIGFRGVFGLVDISDDSQSLTTNEFYVLDRSHVNTYAGYIGLTFGF